MSNYNNNNNNGSSNQNRNYNSQPRRTSNSSGNTSNRNNINTRNNNYQQTSRSNNSMNNQKPRQNNNYNNNYNSNNNNYNSNNKGNNSSNYNSRSSTTVIRKTPNSNNNNNNKTNSPNKLKRMKILIGVEIGVLALLVVLTILYFSISDSIERANDDSKIELSGVKTEGYTNIAIFGVDSRDDELKENTRSDTIILLSINEKTKDVNMVSFYRDTMVYIDNYGSNDNITADDYTKLTHAYNEGGYACALTTLNKNYDLNVDKFVTVNFNVLVEIVDLVGGLEINVESDAMVTSINKYGKEVAVLNGDTFNKVKSTGTQTLDGYQVLGYARTRKIDSDFARASRQREVIGLIFDKVKDLGVVELKKLFDAIAANIYTNLTDADILSLVTNAPSYNIQPSEGFPYNHLADKVDGVSYVYSSNLEQDVYTLHTTLYPDLEYEMTDLSKSITDFVAQKTGQTQNQSETLNQ